VKNSSKYAKWSSSPDDNILLVTLSNQVKVEISPDTQGFSINGTMISYKSHTSSPSTLISPTLKMQKNSAKVDESSKCQ
jgi:predicted ABC-class ATPase